jgi:hypothetical protein
LQWNCFSICPWNDKQTNHSHHNIASQGCSQWWSCWQLCCRFGVMWYDEHGGHFQTKHKNGDGNRHDAIAECSQTVQREARLRVIRRWSCWHGYRKLLWKVSCFDRSVTKRSNDIHNQWNGEPDLVLCMLAPAVPGRSARAAHEDWPACGSGPPRDRTGATIVR